MVVDGRTGAPIPDAEVRWYERELPEAMHPNEWLDAIDELWLEDLGAHDARAHSSGRLARTDAEGRATIEGEALAVVLVAKAPGLWGRTGLRLPLEGQRIELFPDGDLTVRVHSPAGVPTPSVPVLIQHESKHAVVVHLRVPSDDQGVARFPHAMAGIAAFAKEFSPPQEQGRWWVSLEPCADPHTGFEIDPNALPESFIELRLPSTGTVEVLIVENDRPAALELDAKLLATSALPEPPVSSGPLRFAFVRGERARIRDGRAVYANVGLGKDLAVVVQKNSASVAWLHAFRGPSSPGERVSVRIDLASLTVTLAGRLVDCEGKALANRRVAADLFSLPSPDRTDFINRSDDEAIQAGWGSVRTNAEGRFSITYEKDKALGGEPLLVLCANRNREDSLSARVPLASSWSLGVHELGDIVVASTPVAAAGRVIDTEGRAVQDATVGISVFKGSPVITSKSDADGAFVLRSAEPQDDLWLTASAEGFLFDSMVRAQPGDLDVEIVLARGGVLNLDFVFPAGVRPGDFMFHLERTVRGKSTHGWWRNEDRSFRSNPLEPGTYELWIRRGEEQRSKLVRGGLEVRAGETTHPEPIDLGPILEPR